MKKKKKGKKFKGIIKWLDKQGMGYITYRDDKEILITPSSSNSLDYMEEGDKVKFNIKFRPSNPPHLMYQAVDLIVWVDRRRGGGGFRRGGCRCGGVYDSRNVESIVSVERKEDVKKVEEIEDIESIVRVDRRLTKRGGGFRKGSCRGGVYENRSVESIVSVKRKEDVKKVEEIEDCFVLEFDPFEDDSVTLQFSKLSVDDDDDVVILSAKGEVACRDFPHSRHLCGVHPFNKTPHKIHCKMCYCYVCDQPAPCNKWNGECEELSLEHCNATPEDPGWMELRDLQKQRSARGC